MQYLPMKNNGHANDCKCIVCQEAELVANDPEILIFGQWNNFRDFADAMCDLFKPKTAYIYPRFAVFEFEWSSDRRKCVDYLEDRSADRYTGVHVDDDDEYWAVLIDVTREAPEE